MTKIIVCKCGADVDLGCDPRKAPEEFSCPACMRRLYNDDSERLFRWGRCVISKKRHVAAVLVEMAPYCFEVLHTSKRMIIYYVHEQLKLIGCKMSVREKLQIVAEIERELKHIKEVKELSDRHTTEKYADNFHPCATTKIIK